MDVIEARYLKPISESQKVSPKSGFKDKTK